MDRNSAIGMTLIAVLLMVYFYFFSSPPVPPPSKKADSVATVLNKKEAAQSETTATIDSTTIRAYGSLGSLLQGTEDSIQVENADLKISFSSKGFINQLELKKFKTYTQKPLFLIKDGNNQFHLNTQFEGKNIDLYQLHYQSSQSQKNDTTIVTFTAAVSDNASIKHVYSIPANGYKIGYRLESNNIALGGKTIALQWTDNIPLQEKDIEDSRNKTTVNYYLAEGKFDGLGETGTDIKEESLTTPVKWVSIRQKFFISSIIADQSFSSGSVKTIPNTLDSTYVKRAELEMQIPTEQVSKSQASFSYYFGPNDYKIISDVTEGFNENLSLGWPPMSWINRFVIIPIFKFLEGIIGNYGLIIVLLVLFVKLVLLPLSYSSYLGMAKMKLLKPEIDVIKEKNGDNMAQTQQDTMKLYRQAGVNPFAGCIPLLLQMPILFAMFYFFPISIELRQKSFLWAEDLSTYDSILNLPFYIPQYGAHVSLFVLLMTASTLIYTWQNNQISSVTGPMKSLSYIMPVIFLFVLNKFAAGLSFYYFVSNLITFTQQAVIKRFVDEDKIKAIMEENKKKAATGTGKKSKFMTKLEEAMKASEEARKQAESRKKKK
ncbi:MAG: membrane protein insertase YidC [Cyclobacteriaceae bacterium]|nr:membrane protein insertase YidC [Cyclobacteriaceae bacterium]